MSATRPHGRRSSLIVGVDILRSTLMAPRARDLSPALTNAARLDHP